MSSSCITVIFLFPCSPTGDISSISGSDSDSEDEDLGDEVAPEGKDSAQDTNQSPCRLSAKIVFQNMQGQYLSLYRCVLQSKRVSKCSRHFSDLLVHARSFIKKNPQSVIGQNEQFSREILSKFTGFRKHQVAALFFLSHLILLSCSYSGQ